MNDHRRRRPVRPLHVDPRPVFRRIVWLNGAGNFSSGMAMLFGSAGSSGTFTLMQTWLPLTVWGFALAAAGVLQLSGGARVVWGHGIGAFVWLFIAGAALAGLLLGISTSGAGSLLLAGLLTTVAGLHLNGILFRRQESIAAAEAARRGET